MTRRVEGRGSRLEVAPRMGVAVRLLRTTRAAAVLVATGIGAACGGASGDGAAADSAAPGPAMTLGLQDVAIARTTELGNTVSLRGSLEPARTVIVRSQVGGTVRNIRVDRGSDVARGQVMATIEAAGVQGMAAGARAQVAAAEAAVALAQRRLEGARTLRQAGAMSEIDFRSAEATFAAAQAQLAAAKAQAATTEEAAQRATVTAPLTGSVSDRIVEEGEAVGNNDDLFTVVDTRVLELAGQVGIEDAQKVRAGQAVVFSLEADPEKEYRGRVTRVDPRADPGTRQVGVYVQLPNQDRRIVAGQYGRGRVVTGASRQQLAIPEAAVRDTGVASYVFLIENGRLTRRVVSLGAHDESRGLVAVSAGLQEGERILASPAPGTTEGLRVTILSDTSAGTRPAPAADTSGAVRPGSGGN